MEFQNQIKFSMNDTYTEFWFSNVVNPRILLHGLENMLITCGKDINLVFLDLQYFLFTCSVLNMNSVPPVEESLV
jgi:hypothetical protein